VFGGGFKSRITQGERQMRLRILATALLLVAAMGVQADSYVAFADDEEQSEGSGASEPANPCAPETFDANECITPE
jgi:hypothetical protein